jgi:hypothetical protein
LIPGSRFRVKFQRGDAQESSSPIRAVPSQVKMIIVAAAQSKDIAAIPISTFDASPYLYLGLLMRRPSKKREFTVGPWLLFYCEAVLNDNGILQTL